MNVNPQVLFLILQLVSRYNNSNVTNNGDQNTSDMIFSSLFKSALQEPSKIELTTQSEYKTTEKASMDELIDYASQKYGVDSNLVREVIRAESNFNTQAVSSAGAQGLMQLMPSTAESYGVKDPFDPIQNVEGGTKLLGDLLSRYKGNISLALAAYNAGPGAVAKYDGIPPYRETQAYVKKITSKLREIDKIV